MPGNHGGRDHDVAFRDHLAQQLALAPVEILILGFRVAAGVLRVLGFDRQFDKTPAEALDLLLGGRPQIVRGDNGSEPARRGDRLKPRHAAPMTRTRAGVIVPAAVVSMGKIFGSVSAAISTAL